MHKNCDTVGTLPAAKATPLALAMAAALGLSGLTHSPQSAADIIVDMTWNGYFVLLTENGANLRNEDDAYLDSPDPYAGLRTPITGTFSYNLTTGAGTGTIDPFPFVNLGLLGFSNLTLQAIGDGMGNAGPLVLGNMEISWPTIDGIPASSGNPGSIVWDATGMFECLSGGLGLSDTCAGVGALAATENSTLDCCRNSEAVQPMGPVPLATTIWNTTTLGGTSCGVGCNPSGTLPLIADTVVDVNSKPANEIGIGGSPLLTGPLPGWNINLDFLSLHVTSITDTNPVPIPAAAWLFGSGLLGLGMVGRRRKRH